MVDTSWLVFSRRISGSVRMNTKQKWSLVAMVVCFVFVSLHLNYQDQKNVIRFDAVFSSDIEHERQERSLQAEAPTEARYILRQMDNQQMRTFASAFDKLQVGTSGRFAQFLKYLVNLLRLQPNSNIWQQLNIINMPRFSFDPEFRNPCWRSNSNLNNSCDLRQLPDTSSNLRCLPYFLIIGQAKCGTSDLWARLVRHPNIDVGVKETQWLCRARVDIESNCGSIDTYLGMFQRSADFINEKHNPGSFNPYVTGEATPGYFSNNDFWDLLPGNENSTEPRITNPENLHNLVPNAKLILILRNPIDRLYSHYFHKSSILKMRVSKDDFHRRVEREIERFQSCLTSRSLRACCYDYWMSNSLTETIDLRRSIYQVYLEDWLKVFPRNQLHILRFEDYVADEAHHLTEIWNFLGLEKVSEDDLNEITAGKISNQKSKSSKEVGPMLNETRQLLEDFYEPYTRNLANFLDDKKYLWSFA